MAATQAREAVGASSAAEVADLVERARGVDGSAALSEAFAVALGPARAGVVHLLRHDAQARLVGYAQVASQGTEDAVCELVVEPASRRQGHGRALLDAALAQGTRRVWAHGDLEPARALAASAGLERTRTLHLMSRPLTGRDAADPALPEGYSVRAFAPGRDDQAWVRLNAAAFAGHPEQGRLTVADLRERMEQPWFDAADFLLLERGGRVVAFHWTKVEEPAAALPGQERSGAGEVYVVGVDPSEQGRGLGGPLTALGLAHLARKGLATVHLYVDGENTPARRTYQRLGFTDLAVHAQYSTPG